MQQWIDEGLVADMLLVDLPYDGMTNNAWDSPMDLEKLWKLYDQLIKENGAMIFTGRQPFTSRLIMSKPEWFKFTMVWKKNLKSGNLNARKRPMVSFEDVIVFYKKQPTYNPQRIPRTFQIKAGNKKNSKTTNYGKQSEYYRDRQSDWLMPDDVIDDEDNFFYVETLNEIKENPPMMTIEAVHNSSGKIHPTQKPVRLLEWLIMTFSNEGDTVLDNTAGSAATAIAAIKTNRNYWLCEKDKDIYTKAKARIEKFREDKEDDKSIIDVL
tara:strand:- start:895 stop:1698 length:804 start_codon:yes stop_codon:yes gene_type:complete